MEFNINHDFVPSCNANTTNVNETDGRVGFRLIQQVGGVHSHGATPMAGWFIREPPIQMDDLGLPTWIRKPPYYACATSHGGFRMPGSSFRTLSSRTSGAGLRSAFVGYGCLKMKYAPKRQC